MAQVWVVRFRPDDFAEGSVHSEASVHSPDGCGYAALWYKKNGTWHEFGEQSVLACSVLAAQGVPRPPKGFLFHECY